MDEIEVRRWLDEVADPEIPVVNVNDLGMVRDIEVDGDSVRIDVAPTYSGCPAVEVIESGILEKLKEKGVSRPTLRRTLSPAWTTDWISSEGRKKLHRYGIVPPQSKKDVLCPRCESSTTECVSQFGSTACKALWRCNACLEPFEVFKCI